MIHHIEHNQLVEEVVKSNKIVIVDFFATWCVPCQMMTEVLREIDIDYAEAVEIFKVDVDEQEATALRYGIEAMPTLIFFKDGEEVERKVGYVDKDAMVRIIEDIK